MAEDTGPQRELTIQRIEERMRGCVNYQSDLNKALNAALDAQANGEHAYKLAFARERIAARRAEVDGKRLSVDAVDDAATIATDELLKTFLGARSVVDATKQALASVRAEMDTLRSLMVARREGS